MIDALTAGKLRDAAQNAQSSLMDRIELDIAYKASMGISKHVVTIEVGLDMEAISKQLIADHFTVVPIDGLLKITW